MPDLTGFELLDRLKSDPEIKEVPVIFNTSANLGEDDRQRIAPGTAAILSKHPQTAEAAFASIREALLRAGVIQTLS
jgi:CheY-like chemotaxis protein